MPYAVNRPALDCFIAETLDQIEATPMPAELRDVLPEQSEDLTADELAAVWLGAGLASQVGLAILEAPERFLEHRTHATSAA